MTLARPLPFFVALVLTLALASPAASIPTAVRYRNPGPTRTYSGVEVCRLGASPCVSVPRACAPGAECSVVAELPVGTHDVVLVALEGRDRSVASNVRRVSVVAPPACRWDLNGDGVVTFGPSDFAPFLAGFTDGRFTVGDFGAFMRASGTACA